MTRRIVALAALVVLVVGSVAGTATAATPYADPATACEGEDQQLVALLGNGDTASGDLAVFVGTELRFAFCSTESGGPAVTTDAWGIGDVDGLDVVGSDDHTVTVRAVGPMDGVDLAAHVEGRDADRTDAPTLTVVAAGSTNTSYLEDPSEVRFANSSNREAFVEARGEYTAAVSEAQSLTTTLADAADADDPASALDADVVGAVDDRVAAVDDASTRVEQSFVRAAANGGEGAAAAYFAQQAHSTAVASDLESSADEYVAAVESQATDARLFATALLLGPLVAGVLVGTLGGRAISRRDLKQIRRERRRDRTVEYSLGNLWKVFVGAAVAVLAGVAVVVVGVGIGDIIAVIA